MDNAHAPRRPPLITLLRRPGLFWRRTLRRYSRVGLARWLALGVLTGLGSGILASLFYLGLESLKHLLLVRLAGLNPLSPSGESLLHGLPGPYRPWLLPIFMAGVGLVTGILVKRFAPESLDGVTDGTDATIKAFHQSAGIIPPRVPLIKGGTSILTIAAGGSAGQEGPISQLGAGLGSLLARKLHLTTVMLRTPIV